MQKMLLISIIFVLLTEMNATATHTIEPQPLKNGVTDNGINICLDSAHQFLFFWHWTIQDKLREAGFRVTGNMQVLNKTLIPGNLSIMRDQTDHDFDKNLNRPFIRLPNPEFNVLISYQFGKYQDYMPEERDAINQFIQNGGGMLLFGEAPDSLLDTYPAQVLVSEYGASFSHEETQGPWIVADHPCTKHFPNLKNEISLKAIKIDKQWTPLISSTSGKVVLAARKYGKGYLVLSGDDFLQTRGVKPEETDIQFLTDLVLWAAQGKKTVAGDRRVPWEYGGVGGAIYPSNREEIAGVTVFYADNQQDKVLYTIRERTKEVKLLLDRMIPSPPRSADEFYIMPAAGAGGGWAVNVYTPRSASICCNENNTDQLLSIMAHEIAHTMTGPAASDGSANGMQPEDGVGLFSEAHAGWFQKKVTAELGIDSPAHNLKDLAVIDPTLRELDLTKIPEGKVYWAWKKIWFFYEFLEYQFGESFYANWMHEIHEYCKDKTKLHQLTWQETLITLSNAVGADMFAFFSAYGTHIEPPTEWDKTPIKSLVREVKENL